MNEDEIISIVDSFLKLLDKERFGSVPGLIDNFPFVPIDAVKAKKYQVIEGELERLDLVILKEGKDNSTSDYGYYILSPKGTKLILDNLSSKILYDEEKDRKKPTQHLAIDIGQIQQNYGTVHGTMSQSSDSSINSLISKDDRNQKSKKRNNKWIKLITIIAGLAASIIAIYEFVIKTYF